MRSFHGISYVTLRKVSLPPLRRLRLRKKKVRNTFLLRKKTLALRYVALRYEMLETTKVTRLRRLLSPRWLQYHPSEASCLL